MAKYALQIAITSCHESGLTPADDENAESCAGTSIYVGSDVKKGFEHDYEHEHEVARAGVFWEWHATQRKPDAFSKYAHGGVYSDHWPRFGVD